MKKQRGATPLEHDSHLPESTWVEGAAYLAACAVGSVTILALGVGGFFLLAMVAEGQW